MLRAIEKEIDRFRAHLAVKRRELWDTFQHPEQR
jgi:hypothetical protein